MNPARRVADRLFVFVVRSLAPTTIIEGMQVYAVASKAERDIAFERIAAAVSLIARYDGRRWERFLSDVPGVILWPSQTGTGGALNSTTRYCLLNLQVVLADRAGLATASVLAHEGMHARLLRRGVKHSRRVLPRIESVCKRAELHCLARLPEFTNKRSVLERIEREMYDGRASRAAV
jgi:hypothetical protein